MRCPTEHRQRPFLVYTLQYVYNIGIATLLTRVSGVCTYNGIGTLQNSKALITSLKINKKIEIWSVVSGVWEV